MQYSQTQIYMYLKTQIEQYCHLEAFINEMKIIEFK